MKQGNERGEQARNYFIKVEDKLKEVASHSVPLSPAELSLLQAQALVDLEKKQAAQQAAISSVEKRLDNMGDIIALNPQAWREDARNMIVRIAHALGGNGYIQDVQAEIYDLMRTRFGFDLKRRQTNKRGKMAVEGATKTQLSKITKVDVIADDKKMIEAYLIIIKEMAIKYGVDRSA